MEKAKHRIIDGYAEKHHIIPKCLCGLDTPENIVILTPEEHYVAHQLLTKLYPQNQKLVYAAYMMTKGTSKHKRNNKLFGWIKRKNFELQKGKLRKERAKETKPRQFKTPTGKKILTEEHKQKIGLSSKGRKQSESIKIKRGLYNQKGKKVSTQTKEKMRLAMIKRWDAKLGPNRNTRYR